MLRSSLPRRALLSKVPMHQLFAPPPLPTLPTPVPANEVYMIVRTVQWNAEAEVEVLYDKAGMVNGKEIHPPGTRKTIVDTVVRSTEVELDSMGKPLVIKGRFDDGRSEIVMDEGGMAGFQTPMAIVEMADRQIIADSTLPSTPSVSTKPSFTPAELDGHPEATLSEILDQAAFVVNNSADPPTAVKPFANNPVYIKSGLKLAASNVEPTLRQPHQHTEPIPEELNWNSATLIPDPVSPIPITGSKIAGYDSEIGEKLAKSDWFEYLAYRQESSGLMKGKRPIFERNEDIDPVTSAKEVETLKAAVANLEVAQDKKKSVVEQREALKQTQELLAKLDAMDAADEAEEAAEREEEEKKKAKKGSKKGKKVMVKKPTVGETM